MSDKEYEDTYDAMVKEHQEFLNRERPRKSRDKTAITFVIGAMAVILFVVFFGVGVYFGTIEFDYELSKCAGMDSESSSYDFTHRVEINADYNKNCFYIQNHPLARLSIVYGPALLTAVLSCIFMFLLLTLIKLLKFYPEQY